MEEEKKTDKSIVPNFVAVVLTVSLFFVMAYLVLVELPRPQRDALTGKGGITSESGLAESSGMKTYTLASGAKFVSSDGGMHRLYPHLFEELKASRVPGLFVDDKANAIKTECDKVPLLDFSRCMNIASYANQDNKELVGKLCDRLVQELPQKYAQKAATSKAYSKLKEYVETNREELRQECLLGLGRFTW